MPFCLLGSALFSEWALSVFPLLLFKRAASVKFNIWEGTEQPTFASVLPTSAGVQAPAQLHRKGQVNSHFQVAAWLIPAHPRRYLPLFPLSVFWDYESDNLHAQQVQLFLSTGMVPPTIHASQNVLFLLYTLPALHPTHTHT